MAQYTLEKLRNRISSLPVAGYITVDGRLDASYMDFLIHSARAFVVCERWKQYGKIPPIYYQKFFPQYEKLAQDSNGCYVKYYGVPDIIALDGRATGLGYVGSSNTLNQFREVSSRGALTSMMNNRVIKANRKGLVLFEGGGEMSIYFRDKVKMPELAAIFSDPTQVPEYNINFDSYPMDISDIPKMETYLMQGSMGLVYRTPINRVNDSRDVTVPPIVQQ